MKNANVFQRSDELTLGEDAILMLKTSHSALCTVFLSASIPWTCWLRSLTNGIEQHHWRKSHHGLGTEMHWHSVATEFYSAPLYLGGIKCQSHEFTEDLYSLSVVLFKVFFAFVFPPQECELNQSVARFYLNRSPNSACHTGRTK